MKYRYPFTNEIVFALVMQDKEICRGFLQLIFPEKKIRDLKLHEAHVDVEKTIIVGLESRKVRFDVLFEDSTEWYDIEMQCRNEHNIPKRSRYSHGIMDVNMLKPGQDFNELKASYVIFLCCFDPIGNGDAVYKFSMKADETYLPLNDESYTIMLNSQAEPARTPEPLGELFRYMNESVVANDNALIHQIDDSVGSWNTGEGVNVILTLSHEISIKEERARKQGYEEGHLEGLEKGLEEGREKGREEGREEGRREGQVNIAKKLKESGITADMIAKCTGISIEEVQNL